MAEVWEATDEVLSRPVAVKLLHAHLAQDATFVARFRAEAINAARLAHPGIVSIYDTWSGDGVEAIVMELVRGTTLRHLLDHRGPLDPAEAVVIADHVAAALEAAHQAGIVHRDIKPANILLSTDGRVLVTDFGIAKAIVGNDLTTERTMLGTAKYLAPEQVEGAPVDARTDLYALGVVLYEMLCGQVPFRAETEAATALARLHRLPDPPTSHRPGLSPSLESAVLRCLARRPADRPADAAELRRLLAAADRTLAPVAVPPAPATLGPSFAEAAPAATPAPHDPAMPATPGLPSPAEPDAAGSGHRGRRVPWLIGGLVALAILVAGGLALALLRPAPIRAVPLSGAAAYDPLGHPPGAENNALAHLAVDGNAATAWPTERYRDPDHMGKQGVGLILQLAHAARVTSLTISSPSAHWSVAVYPLAPGQAAPSGGGSPAVERRSIPAGTTTLALPGRSADRLLLWITRTGDDGQVQVAEATVRGRTG